MRKENDDFRKLVTEYCVSIGTDPMLVQGAGGNVSWKDNDTLWIKASGTWLADADEKDIFARVDLKRLKRSINIGDYNVSPSVQGDSTLRPSIETLLHALMPQKIVVHVHAIEALAHLVRENAAIEIIEKLKADMFWTMVGYHKPGAALAESVAAAIERKPDTKILLLHNHGVVIGGESVDEVDKLLHELLSGLSLSPVILSKSAEQPKPIVVNNQQFNPVDRINIHDLAVLPELYSRIRKDWVLYPDHVVFLGAKPFCYDSVDSLRLDLESGQSPEIVFIKGHGVFTKSDFSLAKLDQLQCYYDVLVRQPNNVNLKQLTDQQITELLDWDAERYRQGIAK
jgi:rhamnose utilization protein RhaD (predicted bifunctional aldolase and dehydrogenase)